MRQLIQRTQQQTKNFITEFRNAFRGKLNLIKSSDDFQKTQISALADETLQDVELMQEFGFTSVPPTGTEAVILPVGGKTTHSIVIATEHASFRVKGLANGEVAVYDQSGSTIILKKGRLIEVDCDIFRLNCKQYHVSASQSADFSTPKLETSAILTAQGQMNGYGGMAVQGGNGASFSGNVQQSNGNFNTTGDVTAGNISLKNHTHGGDSGGSTTPPR